MDPELLERLRGFLSDVRSAVDPTTPRFFDQGIPGFLKDVAQDIQRRPLSALTPLGDVETMQTGAELAREGRPIAGAGVGALGAVSAMASMVPIGGPVVKAALKKVPETIRAMALRVGDDVVEGSMHGVALNNMTPTQRAAFEALEGEDLIKASGAVTSEGRFVSMDEAAEIVEALVPRG